ncbi:hypothetical protein CO038_00930 [Candidatus Pacearchaeota archaeon CG_4_9_14_0_2_um_filter_39_13]|nr:hypothetical protein [Candidatus Pacearchaeota archaeon]OIO42935.1 MAG: hypothetical protein AUJ64_03115 [Candidatus Pacearchaeota archaeon CG1_02_39_14]PJC44999.1 MAG: hypothetical protein CO038_00930 [Candidatus Pacearchaeota archaeon CG_4_9_14_0_2_um_filter_39_13]
MKIQPYIEKLSNSSEFKEFEKKYGDAYLIAGFFVLDFEAGQNIHQIDYYIPGQKKVAAFSLDNHQVDVKILDMLTDKTPEKLDIKTKIDLEAIRGILEDEMKNRSITEDIRKIIAVIQTIEGDKIWNVNCVLTGMEILKAHIEDESKSVLRMERSSIMDYVKKIPMNQSVKRKPSKKEIDAQLEQLDKLKEALQKEKESIVESKNSKPLGKESGSESKTAKPSKKSK